jgi:hypothetical protein
MEVARLNVRHFTMSRYEGTQSHWRTAALIILASWIVILGMFWHSTGTIVTTWYHSSIFAYGFLVLPISLYLIWIRLSVLPTA